MDSKSKLFALMAFGMAMEASYPQPTRRVRKGKQKKINIPSGCKIWYIGKYKVTALNRKNAIRKALKLRKKAQN